MALAVVKAGLALGFVGACYLAVGTIDYHVLAGLAAERTARPAAVPAPAPAPIWSKKCERQGKDTLAAKADGKPWEARCVERRVLTVPAAANAEAAL